MVWKLKKKKKDFLCKKKKKGMKLDELSVRLGEGAGTASHVVPVQKEKLDKAMRSRIVWELKHGEFGGGSGICLVVGRLCHRQYLSKRQSWVLQSP